MTKKLFDVEKDQRGGDNVGNVAHDVTSRTHTDERREWIPSGHKVVLVHSVTYTYTH